MNKLINILESMYIFLLIFNIIYVLILLLILSEPIDTGKFIIAIDAAGKINIEINEKMKLLNSIPLTINASLPNEKYAIINQMTGKHILKIIFIGFLKNFKKFR